MSLFIAIAWAGGLFAYSGKDPRGFWGATFWPFYVGKWLARRAYEAGK